METAQLAQNSAPPSRNRRMFFAIEFNLLLWMMAWGNANVNRMNEAGFWGESKIDVGILTIGFVIAAIVQHWAYYSIYKAPIK